MPVNINIVTDDLPQIAFSAYVDAALWTATPHERLEAGSRAAAEIVTSRVRNRVQAAHERNAAHGTNAGYASGCRCQFCREAKRVYDRAWRSNNGNNRIHG